jgi:hypothetical protein
VTRWLEQIAFLAKDNDRLNAAVDHSRGAAGPQAGRLTRTLAYKASRGRSDGLMVHDITILIRFLMLGGWGSVMVLWCPV